MKLAKSYTVLIAVMYLVLYNSCQQEEIYIEDVDQKSQLDLSNYKISMTSYEHVKDVNNLFHIKINELLKPKENIGNARLNSSNHDFYVEEDQVQIIEAEDYISYTFLVQRDYEALNVLENYMYIIHNDDLPNNIY